MGSKQNIKQQASAATNPVADAHAIVHSILPRLADQAAVDWSKPLVSWSKEEMTDFLELIWRLLDEARREALTEFIPF